MPPVYFISGLGADHRIFQLLDLSFCEPVFLDWITPSPEETLADYAQRLSEKIEGEGARVVGLSFGGMLATEMAKIHPHWRVMIISSVRTRKEIPWYAGICRLAKLARSLPEEAFKKSLMKYGSLLFSRQQEYQQIIKEIMRDTDVAFAIWALGSILGWQNATRPANVVHVHGTSDLILPARFVQADHLIEGGTHTMTLDQAAEVSQLLKKYLDVFS